MLIEAEVQRMQHNVERFADRVGALESSLATFERLRQRLPVAVVDSQVLNARELAILRLISTGSDNGNIATTLHFALGTIKLHVRDILEKLDVSTRTEAAVQGVRRNLI
jgi:two-component system NarL family response regulator